MNSPFLRTAALLMLVFPAAAQAGAGGSATVAEALSTKQAVPPAVLFVIDRSVDMDSPCFSGSTATCLEDAVDLVRQMSRHYDEVKFGVVGTADDSSTRDYYPIAPVGSTYAQISGALTSLTASTGSTRNLSETLDNVSSSYLKLTAAEDWVDDDADGFDGDWDESPYSYYCSTVYVVVLTSGRPTDDDEADSSSASAAPISDIQCDATGYVGTTVLDTYCRYDNVVTHMYNSDHSSLTDTQRAPVSTIALGMDPSSSTDDSIADAVFASASDNTDSEGLYTNATTKDEAVSAMLTVLADLMSGVYARSNPVIAQNGTYLLYTYYELTGDNPLAEGHVLAYEIDSDPTSSTYGEIIYYAGDPYDDYLGAVWDGGWLLYSRIADAAELNNDDMDGFNQRDIYFYDSTFASYMTSDAAERRLSFDQEMVDQVGTNVPVSLILDDAVDGAGALSSPEYDLNRDDAVNADDVQTLVDFTRGVSSTQFRYLDLERGRWKLQDSPYSAPTVVTRRSETYSNSTSYRTFLDLLEAEEMPDLVLIAANDGLLHAFALTDDENTPTVDESGEEMWAWVPDTLILRERGNAWSNGLIDSMLYGRTYLFDGTPVVEDVWIDTDEDGVKDCGVDLDDCEWRRVVVVQQSFGGSRTLALDITYTDAPEFLWEQTNTSDYSAMGYTTSRPSIFNVYDYTNSTSPTDRWVAFWGGGRAANYDSGTTNYYDSVEANLYMWAMQDSAFSSSATQFSVTGDNIGSEHPDYASASASLDLDSDGRLEYTYISAPPAVVDVDSDGDADVAYFPVTLAYDPDYGPGSTSGTPNQSYIYKALIDQTDPDDLEWCEFYDPVVGAEPTSTTDTGTVSTGSAVAYGSRPEIYYSITTSWMTNGHLGVYWGSGSPFESNTDSARGVFFFMKDTDPSTCTTAKALTCGTEEGGFYQLESGERLTSDPLVYGGNVYFATYTPNADVCTQGEGRVYGLNYEDCGPGLDTTGDGAATTADDDYIAATGFVSNVAVGSNGKLYYAAGTDLLVIDSVTDAFAGTAMVGWMEMY